MSDTAALSGDLAERKITTIIQEIFANDWTGALVLTQGEEDSDQRVEERWSFVSGELYLEPAHRLVSAFRSLKGEGVSALSDSGFTWVELAVAALQRWAKGEYKFEKGPGSIDADLFGPLPTAALVMEGAVQGCNEFELLRTLGGEERVYEADGDRQIEVQLDPQEAFFLSRLDRPTAVKDLLRQTELDRHEALEKLCRLLSVQLIYPQEEQPDEAPTHLLSNKLLTQFSERIAKDLDNDPLDLDPQAHRNKIANLLGRLGTMTFFELLGIGFGATPEQIHQGYTRLARIVHPKNAERLGLEGKEAGMQLLFERATEAYLTLSDQDRSRRYVMEVGSDPGTTAPNEEERRSELEAMAAQNYRQAMAMEARGDYYFAIELLQQAVRSDPRPEYFALLGACQARNPQWIGKAVASLGRAVQLDPKNADLRYQLGQALEAQERPIQAKEAFSQALELMPGHPDATAAISRLNQKTRKKKVDKTGGGLLSRLLRRS